MDLKSEESWLWPSPRFALLYFFFFFICKMGFLTSTLPTTNHSYYWELKWDHLVKGSANYNSLYKFGRVTVIFIKTQIFSILYCPVLCFLIWSLQVHCKFKLREHVLDSACPRRLQYWAHDPHTKNFCGLVTGWIDFFFFFFMDLTQNAVLCDFSGFLTDNKHVFWK